MCIDFDEGSLINRAATQEELNVAQLQHNIDDEENRPYGCQEGSLFATRDIYPGEGMQERALNIVANMCQIVQPF
jgi:hypothetical protein